MKHQKVLLLDSVITLVLGVLLITFPPRVVQLLGAPAAGHRLYLNPSTHKFGIGFIQTSAERLDMSSSKARRHVSVESSERYFPG